MEVLVEGQVGLKQEIGALYAEMGASGYSFCAPSEEVEALDHLIFTGRRCKHCGIEDATSYHPFWRENPRSYVIFVVCDFCGWVEEV
jgi:hypothetical protein